MVWPDCRAAKVIGQGHPFQHQDKRNLYKLILKSDPKSIRNRKQMPVIVYIKINEIIKNKHSDREQIIYTKLQQKIKQCKNLKQKNLSMC